MAKLNTLSPCLKAGPLRSLPFGRLSAKQGNNLFNLKSFNELKKDQTNIKIFKNSSFDSNFNSLQSLNTNLSHSTSATLLLHSSPLPSHREGANDPFSTTDSPLCPRLPKGRRQREIKQKSYNKTYTYNNILSKNILLRNMKYNFLKSTLSSILKKKIRRISEILEEKPIKNYVLYSYLKNCIFTPPHIAPLSDSNITATKGSRLPPLPKGRVPHLKEAPPAAPLAGRSKLSLNKYKGRKFGSFINYNKIIGFNFNSIFYQALPNCLAPSFSPSPPLAGVGGKGESFAPLPKGRVPYLKEVRLRAPAESCNRYIKDIYKLLFYLFKSMYCLISKPVLKYTNDKVTIQLFYYLNIPKKKIFRLFSISYIKSIKKKWLAQSTTAHSSLVSPLRFPSKGGRGNTKLNIRWKIRKAISRLKNKIIILPKGRQGGGINLLFLLRKFNLSKVYQNKFKLICAILSKKFNKPVELQLIRLHHPYHDSNILVNLLSLNIKNKRKKARVAIQKIYNKKPVKNLNDPNLKTCSLPPSPLERNSPAFRQSPSLSKFPLGGTGKLIPAFLSGLNIKIAGRLMGEPIIPRITTKVFGKGASATGKVNYLDVARITKKNRKGAYTIKITSGQNFF